MAFNLADVLLPGVAPGGPGVTVDPQQDRIAELLRIIGQAPEELPVPPAITPLQATTAPAADALSAAAAALNRQTGLRSTFTRQLQELRNQRAATERANVAGRNQATRQAAGVELDEIRRQQGEATRKQEQTDAIERERKQREEDRKDSLQKERRQSKQRAREAAAAAGVEIEEGTLEEMWRQVREGIAAKPKEVKGRQLTAGEIARLDDAEAMLNERIFALEDSVAGAIETEENPEAIRIAFERRARRMLSKDPERLAAVMEEFESTVGAAIDAEIDRRSGIAEPAPPSPELAAAREQGQARRGAIGGAVSAPFDIIGALLGTQNPRGLDILSGLLPNVPAPGSPRDDSRTN